MLWFACVFEGHQEDVVLEPSCWGRGGKKHPPLNLLLNAITKCSGFCEKGQGSLSTKCCRSGATSCFLQGGDWWHGGIHACCPLQLLPFFGSSGLKTTCPILGEQINCCRISCSRVSAGCNSGGASVTFAVCFGHPCLTCQCAFGFLALIIRWSSGSVCNGDG